MKRKESGLMAALLVTLLTISIVAGGCNRIAGTHKTRAVSTQFNSIQSESLIWESVSRNLLYNND